MADRATEIKLTSPDLFAGQLKHRAKFEIREGATIIATGEVKQILNETLIQACRSHAVCRKAGFRIYSELQFAQELQLHLS